MSLFGGKQPVIPVAGPTLEGATGNTARLQRAAVVLNDLDPDAGFEEIVRAKIVGKTTGGDRVNWISGAIDASVRSGVPTPVRVQAKAEFGDDRAPHTVLFDVGRGVTFSFPAENLRVLARVVDIAAGDDPGTVSANLHLGPTPGDMKLTFTHRIAGLAPGGIGAIFSLPPFALTWAVYRGNPATTFTVALRGAVLGAAFTTEIGAACPAGQTFVNGDCGAAADMQVINTGGAADDFFVVFGLGF